MITPAPLQLAAFLTARPHCCHTEPKGILYDIPAQGSAASTTAVTHSKHNCHSTSRIQEDKTAEQFAKKSHIDQISTRELYKTLRYSPELRRKKQMEQGGVNTSQQEKRNKFQKNKIYETR